MKNCLVRRWDPWSLILILIWRSGVVPGGLAILPWAAPSHADVATDSTPTTGETGDFSDGAFDYFGIVEAGGTTIAGSSFQPNETSPSAGDLAGRDHDDGNTKPSIRTATWDVQIPGGVAISSVTFEGTLAAADGSADGLDNWVEGAGDEGRILIELWIDGQLWDTDTYRPPTGSDPFLQQVAAPMTQVTKIGIAVTLTDQTPRVCILPCDAQMMITAGSSSSQEDWWINGTLTAVFSPDNDGDGDPDVTDPDDDNDGIADTWDRSPLDDSNARCTTNDGTDATLVGATISAEQATCAAKASVAVSGTTNVGIDGDLLLISEKVSLKDTSVTENGRLEVINADPCPDC